MATLYEYYNTNDDGDRGVSGNIWLAQTFTPSTAHKITSVKLLMFKEGSPGTVTVSIQGVDGSDHPDGSDLCSGTIDGNSLTTNTNGVWYEITLGDGSNLSADTKYAIVVRAPDGSIGNEVHCRSDRTDPTYVDGCRERSLDGGSSWTSYTGEDFMFEDWGEPLYTIHEKTVTDGLKVGDALIKMPIKTFSDGIAMSDVVSKAVYKTLVDAIALTDVVEKVYTYVRTFTDGIAFTDALVKSISKVFSDGIKFADCLVRWRWLAAVRNLTRPRCPRPSVREQTKIDDGLTG